MPGSDSDSSSGSESQDEVQVESLIAGRQKRTNAGNRMATLLATEETVEIQPDDDDDLKLLFQENAEEEDAEFASGDEVVSDVDMGSSSSDEDGKEDDEEAAEKEIQRQAREEKKRKRKALESFGASKKRKPSEVKAPSIPAALKSTSAVLTTSEPRPKKKSERVSWLPTQEEGPLRASSRRQTMQNKEVIHERMKESEKRRIKQIKQMEAAAKKREAEGIPPLTQEDRLAQAAEVEAMNAKSLNRWETTERVRVEEQRKKLAALKDRGIKGPVLSIWSGPSKWVDGKCVSIGRKAIVFEEKKAAKRKGNNAGGAVVATKEPPLVTPGSAAVPPAITMTAPILLQSENASWNTSTTTNPFHYHSAFGQQQPKAIPGLDGIDRTSPAVPPQVEIQTQILVHLDQAATKESSLQDSVLIKARRSTIKIHGKMPEKERCLVTGLLARYRDPKTGVPYANMAAFKQLRANSSADLYTHGRWSTLLGQYVGSDVDAPKAVPEVLRSGG